MIGLLIAADLAPIVICRERLRQTRHTPFRQRIEIEATRGKPGTRTSVAKVLADCAFRKPITGIAACCARAASGQATAVPPTSAMNSRRLMYQLGLMLILVARLAHFLISAAMNFAKSSGELEAAAS